MILCHCSHPAIYRGLCLFHQTPEGVRPDIDSYTGQVRDEKAKKRATRKRTEVAA